VGMAKVRRLRLPEGSWPHPKPRRHDDRGLNQSFIGTGAGPLPGEARARERLETVEPVLRSDASPDLRADA
jgi:hypothetical protein